MHVVVLGGMARVGKTDVADIIEMEAAMEGLHPIRVSFASPLKEAVAEEHGYDDWRKFKEERSEFYRDQCQEIGALKRSEDPDYWVNLWKDQLLELQQIELEQDNSETNEWMETLVIVDDCRYPNELEAAKEFEAFTMFIYAGSRAADLPEADADWRAHESEEMSQKIEAFLPEYNNLFDWSLFNDKDYAELEQKMEERLKHILGLAPSRFGRECKCNECLAFKSDIQANELIDQMKASLEDLFNDAGLEDEIKDQIREAFEDIIEDLESGKKVPMDFFRTAWWKKAFDGLDVEFKEDDNEDADDCDS